MQVSVSSTLTVYHDGQIWVGLAEHVENGTYGVARIVFGAEEADARFELCFRERGCPCLSFYDCEYAYANVDGASRFRPAIFRRAAHMALEEFATVTNVGRSLAAALFPLAYSVPIALRGKSSRRSL